MSFLQLVLDLVPCECEQVDSCTFVVRSEYYAGKLVVRSRFTEKYAGFMSGDGQFVYVDADEELGRIIFSSARPVTLDLISDWWGANFDAINAIGYEVLVPV